MDFRHFNINNYYQNFKLVITRSSQNLSDFIARPLQGTQHGGDNFIAQTRVHVLRLVLTCLQREHLLLFYFLNCYNAIVTDTRCLICISGPSRGCLGDKTTHAELMNAINERNDTTTKPTPLNYPFCETLYKLHSVWLQRYFSIKNFIALVNGTRKKKFFTCAILKWVRKILY